jgi:hypothetical protein
VSLQRPNTAPAELAAVPATARFDVAAEGGSAAGGRRKVVPLEMTKISGSLTRQEA